MLSSKMIARRSAVASAGGRSATPALLKRSLVIRRFKVIQSSRTYQNPHAGGLTAARGWPTYLLYICSMQLLHCDMHLQRYR